MHQYQPIIESLLEKLKNIFSLSLSTIANISFPVAHKTFITQMRVRQHVWKKNFYGFVHDVIYGKGSIIEAQNRPNLLRHPTTSNQDLPYIHEHLQHFTTTRSLPTSSNVFSY